MLITASFIPALKWKQIQCLSVEIWSNSMKSLGTNHGCLNLLISVVGKCVLDEGTLENSVISEGVWRGGPFGMNCYYSISL